MKKTSKIVAVVVSALLAIAALFVLASCGYSGELTGEVKYENTWNKGSYYGAKVDVTVKNDTITAVKLYTDEETGWTRTSGSWKEGQNAGDLGFEKTEAAYEGWIEENLVGANIYDVLGWSASATEKGQTVGEGVPHIAGATQSSARIICAVQNALEKIEGLEKVVGEAKYENKWSAGSYYGAKVNVYVMKGSVVAVKLLQEDETGWTRTSGTWKEGQNEGDLGYAKTEAAYADYIKSNIVGQKVDTILGWTVTCTQDAQTVGEGVPCITGATQSSARIIAAVQNALGKLAK